ACETKMVATFNARSLFNFFHHRCCSRAQWEIQEYAVDALIKLRKVAPSIFKFYGPSCFVGACPEGRMTCGRAAEIKEKFSNL
ncbi:MAG: FAD-dependent thymidylate synthase, partial [Clostridia bacterium]|nr:FAD-dependent thymidylate synthase [Clostridia bacterium]